MEEKKREVKCPLCEGTEFQEEEGKIDSKWGATAHKVKVFICKKCGYVLLFGLGRTLWDID